MARMYPIRKNKANRHDEMGKVLRLNIVEKNIASLHIVWEIEAFSQVRGN